MTKRLGWGLWLSVPALAVACSGSDGNGDGTFQPGNDAGADARPSSSGSSGRDSGRDAAGDPDASSGGSSGNDGGSSSGASSSSSGETSSSSSGSSGLPPLCDGTAAPGAELGVVLSFGAPAPSHATLADDGLTVAWVTGTAGDIDVHYADRASVAAQFGAATTVHGSWAVDRVAVGSAGLMLVMVRTDRLGFDALVRADRASAFTVAAVDPFSNLNAESTAMAEAGQSYADPVLASSDRYFVYSLQGDGIQSSLRLGSKLPVSIPYSVGTPFTEAAFLAKSGSSYRRPVSLSADQRTLFFFDEVTTTAFAVSRDANGGEFAAPVSLGARLDARPVPGCGSLVYRAPAALEELRSVAFE